MSILNFFKEDLNAVLGVYYDEEKIFLARLDDKLDTAEFNFEIDSNSNAPAIEQLAEKIKLICYKNGWKISKVGLVLRDGAAVTMTTDFKNVPAPEIQNAIKIWAVAHAKTNAFYTYINSENEIWIEALPALIVEEYISAFNKFSMPLCALTEVPRALNAERSLTPCNRAIFAADILKNNKPPNVLKVEIPTWNIKKISLTAAALFLIALSCFSAKLAGDYFSAIKRANNSQFSPDSTFILKNESDVSIALLKRFEGLIFSQDINSYNFYLLVKIAKLYDSPIFLYKIRNSGEILELEGVAYSPEFVNFYLIRLKNYISSKVKLKSSIELNGQFNFAISIFLRIPYHLAPNHCG